MAEDTLERTVRERRRIYEKDLKPRWGTRAVGDITFTDVKNLREKINTRGSPVVLNRTLGLVKSLFNIMMDLELVEASPAGRVTGLMREETPPERALTPAELKSITDSLEKEGSVARAFFGLVMYTAQRGMAVAASTWSEFDLAGKTWTVPVAEGRKIRGYPRMVPLNRGALRALSILREEADPHPVYLFPARKGAKVPHLAHSFWANLVGRLREESKVRDWSLHCLRTSFRTTATLKLGISAEVADLCLGHHLDSVGFLHYQAEKSRFMLDEKRNALEKWGRYLEKAGKG